MKVLFLHCDSLQFKPTKKAIKKAEEIKKESKEVKDCLACFIAVEQPDEENPKEIAKKFVAHVKDIAGQVKAKKVVLYPYAHLSSNLSNPDTALEILKKARTALKKSFALTSAPFGWYKQFSVKVKGHPLSELSREITLVQKSKKEQVRAEKIIKSKSLTEQARKVKLRRLGKKSAIESEKLSENDHRIIGAKQDLFSFHEVAPGMVFFHDKGKKIIEILVDFWRKEHKKRNYEEITSPPLLHKDMWEISGHWENYKEYMYTTSFEDKEFALKPMNCPGGIVVYKSKMRSYKDLPLKQAELGTVFRKELSGVLSGLFRLRVFTQDDAHIYMAEEQMEKEVEKVIELVDYFYKTFGFKYNVELSTRPKKFIGKKADWDKAEAALSGAMKNKKMKFSINKGDGAFYGPKLDFHIKDSLNRSWQLATIQLDFQMPERFDLAYIGKKGENKRPVMIHRVVYGAIERFLGILIEHYKGKFPVWLSPIQARVMTLASKNTKYAQKIEQQIEQAGIRVDSDYKAGTVESKVREATTLKIPYIIVVGEKEEKAKTIAVRSRDGKVKFKVKTEDFIQQVNKETREKK